MVARLKKLYQSFIVAILRAQSPDLFGLVLQNCLRLDGTMDWQRTRGEVLRLLKGACLLLFIPVFFVIINLSAIAILDNYIVPIPIAVDIFSVFNIDAEVWEYNIEKRHLGDVGAKYEKWSKKQGFSPKTARFWQENLWSNWYFYCAAALYVIVAFYLLVVKVSVVLIAYYKQGLRQRRQIYYERDLYSVPRDRLIY